MPSVSSRFAIVTLPLMLQTCNRFKMTKLPTLSMYFHFKSTNSLWYSVNRSLFKWRGWGDNVSVTQTAKKENISFSKKKWKTGIWNDGKKEDGGN